MENLLAPGLFLSRPEKACLLDARSEDEYRHAHIPGAVNLPLLNNEHRHLVGIEYRKGGREAAVELGFKLVGPLFSDLISRARDLNQGKQIYLYCWRGGMRSGIMSWLLETAGFNVSTLKGGYKSFRRYVLNLLEQDWKLKVIGGKTGTGKTELLKNLETKGHQVLDLEGLACHKGSAFGALGQKDQPGYEQFENLIGATLHRMDLSRPLWVENESRAIGRLKIPDTFFNLMRSAPLYEIEASREYRAARILSEYGIFPSEALASCTEKLKKRLGGLALKQALDALYKNDLKTWLDILLDYYDDNYAYGLSLRNPDTVHAIPVENSLENLTLD